MTLRRLIRGPVCPHGTDEGQRASDDRGKKEFPHSGLTVNDGVPVAVCVCVCVCVCGLDNSAGGGLWPSYTLGQIVMRTRYSRPILEVKRH